MKEIEFYVLVELEIIHEELNKVGINVPLDVLSKWKISSRASAEQWAIKKRWSKMKRPPCPEGFKINPGPMPAIVKKWVAFGAQGSPN